MDRVSIDGIENGLITGEAAARHITKVLRLRPGAEFLACDGERELCLRILEIGPGGIRVEEISSRLLEYPADLTIAQCMIKGRGWDFLIEKVAELGVARIAPVVSERTIVKPLKSETGANLERWRRIVKSAAAQSRGRAPAVLPPAGFGAALEFFARVEHKIVVCIAAGARPLADVLPRGSRGSAVLLLGPEGDFTGAEVEAARAAGFVPAHLGQKVLRSETAAITAAALALQSLGGLDNAADMR